MTKNVVNSVLCGGGRRAARGAEHQAHGRAAAHGRGAGGGGVRQANEGGSEAAASVIAARRSHR